MGLPINKKRGAIQKGEVRNPHGRPLGSRHKLTERLLSDLATDWAEHGPAAIASMRKADPAGYVKVCASLVPKEASLTVKNDLETMSEAELRAMIRAELGSEAKLIDVVVD